MIQNSLESTFSRVTVNRKKTPTMPAGMMTSIRTPIAMPLAWEKVVVTADFTTTTGGGPDAAAVVSSGD